MLTIKEMLVRHAHELRPSDGDPAHTRYDGREYIGVLHDVQATASKRFAGWLMPNVVDGKHEWWGPHDDTPGIHVGNLRWDGRRAMWCAQAGGQS